MHSIVRNGCMSIIFTNISNNFGTPFALYILMGFELHLHDKSMELCHILQHSVLSLTVPGCVIIYVLRL